MTAANDFLAQLTSGTFREWAREVTTADPLGFVDRLPYSERLEKAQATDSEAESIRAGFGEIGSHTVGIFCSDYEFMAGTMGIAAAERIVRTIVASTSRGLPVVAICKSGGSRMQEGTPAFVKMMSIGAAISEHRQAALPFITYLIGPSMGGALASWGSQGHLVWAAPEGTISVTGPRVVEAISGLRIDTSQLSTSAWLQRGLVDEIVEQADLGERITQVLDALEPPAGGGASEGADSSAAFTSRRPLPTADTVPEGTDSNTDMGVGVGVDVWRAVERSRSPDRPSIEGLLASADAIMSQIRGDRTGADDPGLIAGITRLRGWPCVMMGFARVGGRGASVTPSGYRKALRAVRLAEELSVPIISMIDTAGIPPGIETELTGLASVVGELMRELLRVQVPTVSVLTGEGSGAGAIALLAADRQFATENAWLTPIAPEAGSAILFRSLDKAPRMARSQRASALSMLEDGIVDEVIPEGPSDAATIVDRVVDRVVAAFQELTPLAAKDRLDRRRVRTRSLSRQYLADPKGQTPVTW